MDKASREVQGFLPLVEMYARRFVKAGVVEFDDLVQEGSIAVWKSLQRGYVPSEAVITNAMRDWSRKEHRRGFTDDSQESKAPLQSGLQS